MIYLLKFDSGDTYVGNSFSRLGHEPPALRSCKQLHNLIEKVELEECNKDNAPSRLAHWIEVLQPSLTWNVGTYSNPEITEVVKLFVNTDLSLKEIADVTHVNYDTVKKLLQGRVHKEATKGLNLDEIKKARKKMYRVYTIEGSHEYEVASHFEAANGLKSGFLSKLKKSGFELPIEKYSFKPYDPRVYRFSSDAGDALDLTKIEAYEMLTKLNMTKSRIQRIFDGHIVNGWRLKHHVTKSNWFPE